MKTVKEEWQERHSSNSLTSQSVQHRGLMQRISKNTIVILLYLYIIPVSHYRMYINLHEVVLYDMKLIIE